MAEKTKRQLKPISLKPLKFEEAVSDILKVKPESKLGEDEQREDTPIGKISRRKKKGK